MERIQYRLAAFSRGVSFFVFFFIFAHEMAFGLVQRLAQLKARRTVASNLQHRRDYGSVQYWDLRYERYVNQKKKKNYYRFDFETPSPHSDTEPFDWYEQYRGSDIQVLLRKRLRKEKDDVILNLGCGNSRLAEDLFEDGYTQYVFPFLYLKTPPHSFAHAQCHKYRHFICCDRPNDGKI